MFIDANSPPSLTSDIWRQKSSKLPNVRCKLLKAQNDVKLSKFYLKMRYANQWNRRRFARARGRVRDDGERKVENFAAAPSTFLSLFDFFFLKHQTQRQGGPRRHSCPLPASNKRRQRAWRAAIKEAPKKCEIQRRATRFFFRNEFIRVDTSWSLYRRKMAAERRRRRPCRRQKMR